MDTDKDRAANNSLRQSRTLPGGIINGKQHAPERYVTTPSTWPSIMAATSWAKVRSRHSCRQPDRYGSQSTWLPASDHTVPEHGKR
ncbi:hypothetical protein [Undibacterium sp. TS12]|uniref:hypothetical protein n=1 Tax=Undibacterium sp. TS12 TaxID=2908202 RepID=UPI001F4C8B5F|nr:hypothetical protein [Undibacterium sp. TS12]MCH8622489.1 hypothetical protein [Undibacterium sp. TS12]